jgi:hypothetical protein
MGWCVGKGRGYLFGLPVHRWWLPPVVAAGGGSVVLGAVVRVPSVARG